MPEARSSQPIGRAFIELQSVDSTNNYARQLIHSGTLPNGQEPVTHGTVVFANDQTHGKGQMGKTWISANGRNITLSILLRQDELHLTDAFSINAACALATHHFLTKYAGDDTKIKWPNDIYWQDRKAGGILIESIVSSQVSGVRWYIVGIGININQTEFPTELPNAVSLKQITGKSFDCLQLAKELCQVFSNRQLKQKNLIKEYNQFLYKRNEKVKFKKDNRVFEGTVKEVTPEGKLKVMTTIEELFDYGQITWIISSASIK